MEILYHAGRYFELLFKVFSRPERGKLYAKRTINEVEALGLNSIGLVALISVFMGGIITLQLAYNMENPLLPSYLIGLGNRDTLILEFSCTILALILAGKIGSNITSEIGSMRVTEQIDSLEIMGVNSATYLILPKLIAVVLIFPFLSILSMFFGLLGGALVGPAVGAISLSDYVGGIQYLFNPSYVAISLIKSLFYGFIISSVSAYWGYYVEGGALEVGAASTKAVVNTNILILVFDLILTQLLM
ncbi:MAG: MlaE family ABC transporter permease [Mangrovibacterium sp.]